MDFDAKVHQVIEHANTENHSKCKSVILYIPSQAGTASLCDTQRTLLHHCRHAAEHSSYVAKNAYSVQEALHKPFNRIQTGIHVILILNTEK